MDTLMQYIDQAHCPVCRGKFTVMSETGEDGIDYIPVAYNNEPYFVRALEADGKQPCPHCGAKITWPEGERELA